MHPSVTLATCLLSSSVLLTGCFAGAGAQTKGADPAAGGGRIKLAMMQPPRSALSPFSDDAFKLSRWSTAETLVKLDEIGDARPGLATSWKHTSPLTWEFVIRPGVKFHDGTQLTAVGAAFALTRATTASPKPRILDGVRLTAVAKGNILVVTTAEADPLVPQRLSSPQLSILAKAAYGAKRVSPIGTGSGPYRLVEVRGTSSARLDRYDGYWGEKAHAAGIDVSFVPDGAARAAAIRSGSADLAESIPVSQAALLDPKTITEVPMPRTNTLYPQHAIGAAEGSCAASGDPDGRRSPSLGEGRVRGASGSGRRLAGPGTALGR